MIAGALVTHAAAVCTIEVEAGLIDLLTNGWGLRHGGGQAVGKAALFGR